MAKMNKDNKKVKGEKPVSTGADTTGAAAGTTEIKTTGTAPVAATAGTTAGVRVVNGLENIGQIAANLKLPVIKLPDLPKLDSANLGASIEEQRKTVIEICAGVTDTVAFLGNVKAQHEMYKGDRIALKFIHQATDAGVVQAEEYLKDALALKEPIFQQMASIAYVKATLSGEFTSHDMASKALRDLETRKLLIHTDNRKERITVGYDYYRLSPVFGDDKEDLAEIGNVIAMFSTTLKGLIAERRKDETAKALAAARITLAQASQGAKGLCLVTVPAEDFIDNDRTRKHRAGGKILGNITEEDFVPISGIGGVEGVVEDCVRLGIVAKLYQFAWQSPPGWNSGYDKELDRIIRMVRFMNPDMEEREIWDNARFYLKKEQALWFLLHRAVLADKAEQTLKKELDEFRSKTTITPAQFFELDEANPARGTALLEYEGCYKCEDYEVYHLFFLATTSDNGTVTIEEVPSHTKKLLGEYVGKSFPMNEFQGDLGRIMGNIHGLTKMAVDIKAVAPTA